MSLDLLEKCLSRGIRMTSQRQVIVGVIGDSEDHPDVDELYRRAVDEDSTISIATVYRTVKLLEEAEEAEQTVRIPSRIRILIERQTGNTGMPHVGRGRQSAW